MLKVIINGEVLAQKTILVSWFSSAIFFQGDLGFWIWERLLRSRDCEAQAIYSPSPNKAPTENTKE